MADNTLQGIRATHPEYNDLSDTQLADSLYKKFYADMPRADFDAKIGLQATPAQPQSAAPSVMDNVGRQLGLTARYGAEGAMALPNMIGDAANSAINLGSSVVNKMAGTNIPPLPMMSSVVESGLDKVGLPKPETTIEKIVAEPSKFVASIPSFGIPAAASKLQELAPLAEKYLNQALGATTGGAALGITKEVAPDNKSAQLAATILGAAAGGRASAAESAPTEVRSVQQVKNAADAAYKEADKAGLIIKPDAVKNLTQQTQNDLAEFGYHPDLQPRVATVLKELGRVADQNVTAKQMQILRTMANSARMSTEPSEQKIGGQLVSKIDDFMENLGPDDVLQGDSKTAAQSLKQGAQLWKMYRKSQDVDTRANNAELNAAVSGSGGNVANATRQQIKAILIDPRKLASYTPDEIAQMNDIARGGKITNALRLLGKFSPTTGALPAMAGASAFGSGITAAAMTGNPWAILTGAIPLAGYGAKLASDARTIGGVDKLSELIRSGGTKASLEAAKNPPKGIAPDKQLSDQTVNYLRLLLQSYGLNNGDTLPSPSAGLLSAPIGIAGQNTQDRRR